MKNQITKHNFLFVPLRFIDFFAYFCFLTFLQCFSMISRYALSDSDTHNSSHNRIYSSAKLTRAPTRELRLSWPIPTALRFKHLWVEVWANWKSQRVIENTHTKPASYSYLSSLYYYVTITRFALLSFLCKVLIYFRMSWFEIFYNHMFYQYLLWHYFKWNLSEYLLKNFLGWRFLSFQI